MNQRQFCKAASVNADSGLISYACHTTYLSAWEQLLQNQYHQTLLLLFLTVVQCSALSTFIAYHTVLETWQFIVGLQSSFSPAHIIILLETWEFIVCSCVCNDLSAQPTYSTWNMTVYCGFANGLSAQPSPHSTWNMAVYCGFANGLSAQPSPAHIVLETWQFIVGFHPIP